MKIIYLYPSLAVWGGIERILVDKMNYLVRQNGDDIYMITSDQGQHPIPYAIDERIHLIDLNIRFHSRYNFGRVRRWFVYRKMSRSYHKRLYHLLKEIKPDVMVCTTSQNVYSLLKIKGKTPLVVEAHTNFFHPDTWIHRMQTRLNNYWIEKAEAVVSLTEEDAKNWHRVSKHVHVIPNIVHLNETEKYSECVYKRAIFVGRLVEQKGLSDLIAVWKMVNRSHPDWLLDVYGDGKMDSMPEINMYVHAPVSTIFDKYIESSMLLLTSVFEPFGLVMPEAMSCGLPVVAFDSPYGPAAIITDGKDGFLIRNRDYKTFADRVCLLIEDYELRQRMSRNAILSSQRFSADKIMPLWKALFSSLTSKEPLTEGRE